MNGKMFWESPSKSFFLPKMDELENNRIFVPNIFLCSTKYTKWRNLVSWHVQVPAEFTTQTLVYSKSHV